MEHIPDIRPDPWLTWVVYLEWAIAIVVVVAIIWRERAMLRVREQHRMLDALAALDALAEEHTVSDLPLDDLSVADAGADAAPAGVIGGRRQPGRTDEGSRLPPWPPVRGDLPTRGPSGPGRHGQDGPRR